MVDRRFRRRRSLRSILLFATGFCSLFVCFSWYTLMCCRTNMYEGYIINNYPAYPLREISEEDSILKNSADASKNDNVLVQKFDSSSAVVRIDSSYSQDHAMKTFKSLVHHDKFESVKSSYTKRTFGDINAQTDVTNILEVNSKRGIVKDVDSYNSKKTLPVPSAQSLTETNVLSVKHHSFHDTEETRNPNIHVEQQQNPTETGLFNNDAISLHTLHTKAESITGHIIDDIATASASNTLHSIMYETNSKLNHNSIGMGDKSPLTNRPQTILPDSSATAEQYIQIASLGDNPENRKTSADYAHYHPRNPAVSDQLTQTNRPQSLLPVTSGQDLQIGDTLEDQKATYYSHLPPRTINIRSPPTILPNSIPPTFELDRYAVKAWLPRGIKERTESSSQESSSVANPPDSSGPVAGQRLKSNIVVGEFGGENSTQKKFRTNDVVNGSNRNRFQHTLRQDVVVNELDIQKPSVQLSRHGEVGSEHGSKNSSLNRLRRDVVITEFSPRGQDGLRQDLVASELVGKIPSQQVLRQDMVVGEISVPGLSQQGWRRDVVVSEPVKRLPQALIIGVKKCGTRALLEFLRVHPDVRASGPETHFFDRHYQRGLEWYRHQMPASLEGQITMEKTPSYFITRDAPPRIRAALSPSARLLVVVRDPVTRAVSDYTQSASKRPPASKSTFEEMAFLNASTGLVDTSWPAIRLGVYARFLEWWTPRYFPKEQILFISGEELVRDPAAEMGRVQDFLGLKRIVSEKHFYFNETKGFPCLKKSEGSGNPHCLGKTKGRAHPDISSATIQRLRDFYRPFNVKFYQMVGRNFGWP